MKNYVHELAEFSVGLRYDDLSPSVRTAAKNVIKDTIGAMAAGSRLPQNTKLANLVSGLSANGTSVVVGHKHKSQPMFAALVNATAGVSLELDEGTRLGGGHPAIHVLPGSLAFAEDHHLSGKKLIEALSAGYEILSRIAGSMILRPNVHSHGTWGTIGTSIAIGKMLELDLDSTKSLINLAASMSPANTWTPCFEGATIRNVYPGRSGMQGILAVHLLQCGFTSLKDGPLDVYGTILARSFDPEMSVEGLGFGPMRIEQNYFKHYPCCLFNHPTLGAIEQLMDTEQFAIGDIERIRVTTVNFGSDRMAGDYPRNMLGAKFHIPYAVSALLVRGSLDLEAFSDSSLSDPLIRELSQKITIEGDPKMDMRKSGYPFAAVQLILKGGRSLESSSSSVKGDHENPCSHEILEKKFRTVTREIFTQGQSDEILSKIDSLEQIDDMKELTELLMD